MWILLSNLLPLSTQINQNTSLQVHCIIYQCFSGKQGRSLKKLVHLIMKIRGKHNFKQFEHSHVLLANNLFVMCSLMKIPPL